MALFQKRHYIALAKALYDATQIGAPPIEKIVDMLASDNPNFDCERFEIAAYTGKVIGKNISGGPAMPYYQGGNRLMRR